MSHNSRPIIRHLHLYQETEHSFIIIAHRGSSSKFPENTLCAFKEAVSMRADMIELDIQLSRDGVPMVFHDDTLERCTNGTGKLNNHTLAELKKLDAGSWKSSEFAGEKIPTLEEVLDFAKNRIAINIEIKVHAGVAVSGIEQIALDLVKKYDMEKNVLFSCFNPAILKKLRNLSKAIPLALLYERNDHLDRPPIEMMLKDDINAFNCSQWSARKSWIKELKRHEIPMLVYTVNNKWLMRKFIRNGAKGLFTNKPDVLRKVLHLTVKDKV